MEKAKQSRWKPPIALLILDALGVVLLVIGLWMHYAPDAELSRALPGFMRLPLMVVGGGLFAGGWAGMLLSVLRHGRD